MNRAIRIIGIDPGLRRTGWGVVDIDGNRVSHVANGVCAPAGEALAERLAAQFGEEVVVEHEVLEAPADEQRPVGELREPLIDAGRLPNWERLIADGVAAPLATQSPTWSPIICRKRA